MDGRVVGFEYIAVKDLCKWYKLPKKRYIPFFLEIGRLVGAEKIKAKTSFKDFVKQIKTKG